jgi:DNA repair protein RadC
MRIPGVGRVKAIQILCAVELSKRLARESKGIVPCFSRPDQLAAYFMEEMRNLETEHLYAAYLDTSGRLLHYENVFKGTICYSIVNPREILRIALLHDASHYIVLHNHPSGDPSPSREDVDMTKRLTDASELVGISLSDHIIIGDNRYVSLKERGLI